MGNWAVVRKKDGVVINNIMWDGKCDYTYPEPDVELIETDLGFQGDVYKDGKMQYEIKTVEKVDGINKEVVKVIDRLTNTTISTKDSL
jgi:hypothetical protein